MYQQLNGIVKWLSRKRVMLFVLIFSMTVLSLVIYRFASQNNWLEAEFDTQVQNVQLNEEIAELILYIKMAESADRGYAISGNPEFVKNFDATIDSIRAIYLEVQQLENRQTDQTDGAPFMKSDSLIQKKIAFMQHVKSLCDQHEFKASANLIAGNEGLHLADSIAGINKQISDNIHARLQRSQSGFLKVNTRNNNLAYTGIGIAMLIIVFSFFLLMVGIRKTKKISEELFIRKENYRVTLNSLGEAMISTDREGYIQYMNPVAEKLTGWSWEDAKKKQLHTVFDVVNEETGQPFENIVSRILKMGKTIGLENNTILKAKNDSSFIISNSGSPIFDINGDISGTVLVFSDITEKYKTTKLIRESEEKYRNLVEQASDAILICSFDGTIHEFNKACYTILGYTEKEFSKLKITDILTGEIIEDQENYAKAREGKIVTTYRKLMRRDGSLIETEITVKMLPDGKAIAFARDVTERRKAEQALKESEIFNRSILTSIDYHIAVVEATGNIISVNKAWNDFSMQNGETALERTGEGSNYIAVCKASADAGDSIAAKALQGFQQVVKKEIPFFEMEYPCDSADEQRWFLLRVVNFSDDSPKVVMMHIDITTIKKTEELLVEKEKEFRSLAESMPQIVWTTRADGWNIYFNQHWVDYTGLTLEESYGDGWNKPFHPDDQQRAWDAWQNAVTNLAEYNLECRLRKHDGTYHWWLIRGVPQVGNNGEILKWYGTYTDIEQIKKQEEIIKKEKELSDSVINSLPGVFYFYDEHLKLLGWNKQLENVTGYTSAELSTMNPAELFRGEDRTYMQQRSRKVFASGSGDAEANITTKTGKKIPYYFTGVRMQYQGKPTLLGIGIDITERKIAEKEIRDYKLALDESSLVDISDSNGIIQYANENLCRISKYSKKELIGQNHRILNSGYHPKELFQQLWNTVEQGKIWRNEVKNKAKDGSYFWVDTTIVPFLDNDGKPLQFITIRSDITKRKNAEVRMAEAMERYDILAQATSDTIWDWDIINNKMLYNEGISKMFGYNASEVENVVDWWNEKLHSEDFQNVTDALEDIFEKNIDRLQFSYRFRCADGSYKHIFDRAFVIFDEKGSPVRMIGAMQDITHQAEEEIRVAKAIIDTQEQERQYLGAELHDNINQILAGTLLTLGMAKSKNLDAEQRTQYLESAMGYITDTINETRRLSHELAPAAFDDNSLKDLFETLLMNINLDNRFNIKCKLDVLSKAAISETIQVNLYRILQEQTKNILKYAEASVIETSVTVSGNVIRMRIYDNGKGFDTKTKKTGIGLSNIKKRAESLSGKFILKSSPGKGCEVVVEIPLSI